MPAFMRFCGGPADALMVVCAFREMKDEGNRVDNKRDGLSCRRALSWDVGEKG